MYYPLLIAVVVVAAPAPDAKDDNKLIQGKWSVVSIEHGGEKEPADDIKKYKIVIDGNAFTANDGKKDEKATIKLDPDKKPKTIDITPEKDGGKEKIAGIYELKGDELKICFGKPGDGRPTEFASKRGTEQTLVILKREK